MTVCQDDPRFAAPPAVGDVVTFLTRSALDMNGTLFMTGGSTLLYDHDGTVVLPPGLDSDAELRRIGFARKLAHVLRETREEHRYAAAAGARVMIFRAMTLSVLLRRSTRGKNGPTRPTSTATWSASAGRR
jgi:hypothetical protein